MLTKSLFPNATAKHVVFLYSHGSHMSGKIMLSSQKGNQIWHDNTIPFHIHTNKEL